VLAALVVLALTVTLGIMAAQTVRRDLVVDGNGTVVAPVGFWATNAAGITNAIGAHYVATNDSRLTLASTALQPGTALTNISGLQTALDGKAATNDSRLSLASTALQPSGNGSALTGLTKAQVGLGNATDTSDANKPVSTATQAALDLKEGLHTLTGGVRQVVTVTCNASVSGSLGGTYFDVYDASGPVRIWYNTGNSTAPATPSGGRLVSVTIPATRDVANVTQSTAAAAYSEALWVSPVNASTVTSLRFVQPVAGPRAAPSSGTSGFSVSETVAGIIGKTTSGNGFPWQARRNRGTRIALLGDSVTNYNIGVDAANGYRMQWRVEAWFQIANAFWLGGAWRVTGDFGVSGDTAEQMLPRIYAEVVPTNPDYCTVLAGTNDLKNLSAEVISTRVFRLWDELEFYGIRPIACTIMPYGTASDYTTYNGTVKLINAAMDLNDRIRKEAALRGYICIDLWKSVADVNTGLWASASYHAGDNVHPSEYGAWKMAAAVADALSVETWTSKIDVLPSGNIANPNFQLLDNPLMLGNSTGTTPGLNVAAAPVVYTKVARTDGFPGEWQQVNTGNSTSAAQCRWVATTGYSTGDIVMGCAEVYIDSADAAFSCLEIYVQPFGGASSYAGRSIWGGGSTKWPSDCVGKRAVLWTTPVQIPSGTTSIRVQVQQQSSANTTNIFRVGRIALYKIPPSEVPSNTSFSDASVFP
jgi:lysophospholipase L1-like esterase